MLSKNTTDYIYDFYIFSIAQALRYLNDQMLLKYSITNRQARLLGILYRSLKNEEEINNQKLQDMMNLKGPSITSLLNGLEKNKFIIRTHAKKDRRLIEYKLTKKSLDLIEETQKVFTNTEKQLLTGMTKQEKQTFLTLLDKAYKNLSSKI